MISIITVTHNSYELMSDYVDSFLAHHSKGNALGQFEFIFIENSGDERIVEHTEKLQNAGFSARSELMENRGFGAGCNLGASLATGDILVFANPDLQFTSEIRELEAAFGTTNWGTVAQTGERGRIYAFDLLPEYRNILTELMRISRFCHRIKALQKYAYPVGSFMVVPRASFEASGGFDERFFLYYEEAELSRRLHAALGPPIFLPSVHVRHETFGTQTSSDFTFEQEAISMVKYADIIGRPELARKRVRMLRLLSYLSAKAGVRAEFHEQAIAGKTRSAG